MKKWILWTGVATLVVAIIIHFVTLTLIPYFAMSKTINQYTVNTLLRGQKVSAEENRQVVRPSPELVYTIVSYDVSQEPIRLKAKVPTDVYWSVSMFQENSDNFFVMNDRQVKSNPMELVLAKAGTNVSDAGNAQVVFSPTNRGILLIRHLLESDDKYKELQNIQKESALKIGSAPFSATVEMTEYTNQDYGFSIKYPKEWKENPVSGKQVFAAAAAAKIPVIIISVRDEASFADAVHGALTDTGNTEISMGPEKEVKLSDGTPARQAALQFKLKTGYKADALAQGVQKDGKWILGTITTVSLVAPYDEAQYSAILQSLQFKK